MSTNRIRREVGAKARSKQAQAAIKGKQFNTNKFLNRFVRRFKKSLDWLRLDSEGWHYGYLLPDAHVPEWRRHHGRQHTFYIYNWQTRLEGYGAWYPYHHQYHHLIPESALHKYLIGNDDKTRRRVEIICASGWNINKGLNIVLLPQEIAVSKIVGLPAHCPWDSKSHPTYSKSMKSNLEDARRKLTQAMKTGACEDVEEVAIMLDDTCKQLLEKIKTMKSGRELGRA